MGAPRQVKFFLAAALVSLVTVTFAQGPPASFEAAFPEGMHATFLVRFDRTPPEATRRALHFDIDREGRPVLVGGRTLVAFGETPDAPAETLDIAGVERVDAFACMTDGTMLVVSGHDLGQITDTGFQKMLALPAQQMRVAPASADVCYLFGGDTPDQQRDVWLYRKGGKLLRLVRAESPVTAVAGTGDFTFFAVGKSVLLHVQPEYLPGQLRLVHTADDEVTALALSPRSGVFYATAKGVGYVARPGSGFTFLRGKEARLCTRDGALYLFFPDEGVLRCSPVALFEKMNHDLAVQKTDGGVRLTAMGQRAFERGLQAATVNDWEAAVKHFETARDDAPYAPEVLYNLALACDRSGSRDVPAIVWYRAWLATGPKATETPYVHARITQLALRVDATVRRLRHEALMMAGPLLAGDDRDAAAVVRARLAVRDFAGARVALFNVPESTRNYSLLDIVQAQVKSGDLAGARVTLAGMTPSGWQHDSAVTSIASAQCERGDLAGAAETLKLLDSSAGDWVRSRIAATWMKAGNMTAAEPILRGTGDAKRDSGLFRGIAERLAADGEFTLALAMAARVTEKADREKVYSLIALKMAEKGDAAGATEAAATAAADPELNDPHTCLQIARAYAMLGRWDDARQMTSRVPWNSYWDRAGAVSAIAEGQAAKGDAAAARRTLLDALAEVQAAEPKYRTSVLIRIARAQCELGDFDRADGTVWLIRDDGYRRTTRAFVLEKRGDLMHAEVETWAARVDDFRRPYGAAAADNLRSSMGPLAGRSHRDVCNGLVTAARELEQALESVRDRETYWQTRRARAK